jgi:DNA-directed RNA polymerase subunit A'
MTHYIKKIEQINFGLMSPEDIRKMSVVTVEYPDTYGDDGFPIEKGLMDPRLGIIDPSLVCRTCGFKGGDCQGHFGSIELARPVIHVGFGDIIHKILRSTCNECGRVLLNDDQIEYYTEKIKESMGNKESINNILKEVYRDAKRELKQMPEDEEDIDMKHCCPHCGTPQEAIILDKPVTIRQGDYKLTPSEVRERLEKITDDDAYILGVNAEVARPEWLVLTVLPVPPVTVRPSITLDTGERSEDDLTHKLVDILRINQRLLENMEAGAPQLIVEDLWELLQYHVTTYFDNEASGVPPARHRSGRPLKTLTQRLKGKEGRFRSNLSGKRVNFSARTVISPDPNISINEVGVPEMIAKEVTVPVHVNEWNIDEMRTFIENGPDIHPGANYVISNDGKTKRRVTDETKEFILEQLQPGFIVERHLKDGDMVLFNRQPSLHRMSMMAHEVRVLPYKTFRLNLCVCPPYNADFDGDEMNMHVFQTDESRAEAKSLMRVQEHILSPRFGGPIIGAIHDHISGAYLLTRDGVEFTEEEALQIIRKSHLAIPPFKSNQWVLKYDPDFDDETFIFKEKGDKWTGKELFSLLLPNDLNLSYSAEIAKGKSLTDVEIIDEETGEVIETRPGHEGIYPATDGFVVIKNGILEQGSIDESAYGSFSGKILDKIVKEYGPGRAKEFLDRSTDLAICGIMKTGITTSLNDEEIPEEAQDRINEHLNKKMDEVDMLVQSYEEGYLQALPGRSLEETLEMKIMQVLGEARDMSGNIAENYLTMGKQFPDDSYEHVMAVENHSVVMARTGARASMLNLTQITACVGQQAVRGGRIERGYIGRTLPHFKKGELGAKAKGFVHSSYKSGLDPIEFFFHAMGGREGLVDTAIRTAQSGYMQRRLVNALQDLQVKPSGLVTDNQGNVIQTMFGEDGVDPAKSDFGKPADLNKLIDEIRIKSDAK